MSNKDVYLTRSELVDLLSARHHKFLEVELISRESYYRLIGLMICHHNLFSMYDEIERCILLAYNKELEEHEE